MATVIDFATAQPRPAPRAPRRRKRPTNGDFELLDLGRQILQTLVAWDDDDYSRLTPRQSEARSRMYRQRLDVLRDRYGPLDPTTLAGLAMMMRVEFAEAMGR